MCGQWPEAGRRAVRAGREVAVPVRPPRGGSEKIRPGGKNGQGRTFSVQRQSLTSLQPSFEESDLDFIPYRGDFPRGIFATAFLHTTADQATVDEAFAQFYATAPFTHYVAGRDIDLKQVVNTNKAIVHAEVYEGKLLVTSCIDNLLKGASGQAVENMNLMFGIDQTAGLQLKPQGF